MTEAEIVEAEAGGAEVVEAEDVVEVEEVAESPAEDDKKDE